MVSLKEIRGQQISSTTAATLEAKPSPARSPAVTLTDRWRQPVDWADVAADALLSAEGFLTRHDGDQSRSSPTHYSRIPACLMTFAIARCRRYYGCKLLGRGAHGLDA